MLLCLRPDHDRVAGLRTACLREVLPVLSSQTRETLAAPEFITAPPPSFGTDNPDPEPSPILTGAPEDPDMRMAQIATRALTPRATAALTELVHAFDHAARTTRLAPGDLALIDNRVTAHGRTAFHPPTTAPTAGSNAPSPSPTFAAPAPTAPTTATSSPADDRGRHRTAVASDLPSAGRPKAPPAKLFAPLLAR